MAADRDKPDRERGGGRRILRVIVYAILTALLLAALRYFLGIA
jgi:hypothetical protein